MDCLRSILSLVLYLFIGTEIFINLPINLDLNITKEHVLTYGGLITISVAILLAYIYPLSLKMLGLMSLSYVLYVYLLLRSSDE